MPRYIDIEPIEKCDKGESIAVSFALLKAQPTADVVEVVRCKDCLHYENGFCYNPNTYDDEKTRGNTIPNWFCADGKRKTDD